MALFCLFFYADSLRQYGGDGVDVSHRKIDVPPPGTGRFYVLWHKSKLGSTGFFIFCGNSSSMKNSPPDQSSYIPTRYKIIFYFEQGRVPPGSLPRRGDESAVSASRKEKPVGWFYIYYQRNHQQIYFSVVLTEKFSSDRPVNRRPADAPSARLAGLLYPYNSAIS